jgi:hypothetical protein
MYIDSWNWWGSTHVLGCELCKIENRISWHEFVDMKLKFILLLYDNGFIFYASLCKETKVAEDDARD